MGSSFRNPSFGSSSGVLPIGVKWLLISNTAFFLLQFVLYQAAGVTLNFLKLIPIQTVSGYIWQPLTYMFLHDVHSTMHILWNMISLFFTGPMLEVHWGTTRFLKYYFLCGIGAGICVVLASFIAGTPGVATIGCSGALFGVLVAYGLLFPDVLFFGVIKAKWFVIIIGAVNLLDGIASRNAGVSHVAHLGGMAIGFLIIRFGLLGNSRGSKDPLTWLEAQYKNWKLARARKKFEVYMRNQSRH
ncbi:MAG: rhomboid family intramembrane serine protease [Acidobacteria bacterium]|nr:rhomboid family intramembrane serine protease [Acidobacteriota bacterium]